MAKQIAISRLKNKCEVGEFVSGGIDQNTGITISKFKKLQEIWFGDYSVSINEQLTLAGAYTTDNRTIVVRSSTQVEPSNLIKIDDEVYRITNIQRGIQLNDFDVLTLEKNEGHRD